MCENCENGSPAETITSFYKDNLKFVAENQQALKDAQTKHKPKAIYVLCGDARCPVCAIISAENNDIGAFFGAEHMGCITERTQENIEYAVNHLGAPLVYLVGHSGCGAINASQGDYSQLPEKSIQNAAESLANNLEKNKHRIDPDLSSLEEINQKEIHNSLIQTEIIISTFNGFAEKIADGKLYVVAAFYDFTGSLGGKLGKVYTYAINGETDAKKLLNSPLLEEFNNEEKKDFLLKTRLK